MIIGYNNSKTVSATGTAFDKGEWEVECALCALYNGGIAYDVE